MVLRGYNDGQRESKGTITSRGREITAIGSQPLEQHEQLVQHTAIGVLQSAEGETVLQSAKGERVPQSAKGESVKGERVPQSAKGESCI